MMPFFAIAPTLLSAAYVIALGLVVGFPLSAVLEGDTRSRLLIAPAMGLGLFGVIAVLAFHVLPLSPRSLAAVIVLAAVVAALLGRGTARPLFQTREPASLLWLVAAIALAVVPAFANAPHMVEGSLVLGATVFDHAKASIIDEIARNGLPAHNPFYQQAGTTNVLNYYYLWYLLAATAEHMTGANGWEADVAMTGATAFLSLTTLAWAAVAYAQRGVARWWVLAIAGAATLRFPLGLVAVGWLHDHVADEHRFEGWLEQASWVPQHLFAATLAILAILALVGLMREPRLAVGSSVIVGVLVAASYDSSIWIGGFGLAMILPLVALVGLVDGGRTGARTFVANLAIVVMAALSFVAVFFIRNLSVIGHRHTIAIGAYNVLIGDGSIGARLANELAYWLLMLTLDFGFAYVLALAWCFGARRRLSERMDLLEVALGLSFLVPLVAAQVLQSVIASNDLGWRIVQIPLFAMTIIAAAFAARVARACVAVAALVLLAPAIASGAYIALGDVAFAAKPKDDAPQFVASVELWRAVRAVTPKDQAVLNNPNDLADMTPWPGNIGWALLSNRGSCAAGWEWLRAYAPQLLPDDVRRLDDRLDRVFKGQATSEDFRVLKRDNLCSTLVVVPSDGLWASDLMTNNSSYTLVDSRKDRWRIYR